MTERSLDNEKAFLEQAFSTYRLNGSSQNRVIRDLVMRTFDPYLSLRQGATGLELGYADGYETALLSGRLGRLDVVEGSETSIKEGESRNFPNVNFIYSLFEEFSPPDGIRYDYVFANFVMEHVIDVDTVLQMIRSILKPDGLFFVTVPNARALSRQLALRMKLLDGLYALTENDIHHGHRRVYDRVLLNNDLDRNGFLTVSEGGIMFKILADFQLDRLIDDRILAEEHIDGLYRLGLEYPEFAGSIFSVCRIAA